MDKHPTSTTRPHETMAARPAAASRLQHLAGGAANRAPAERPAATACWPTSASRASDIPLVARGMDPLRTRPASAVPGWAAGLRAWLRGGARRTAQLAPQQAELMAYNDRELADLGIRRRDIPALARSAAGPRRPERLTRSASRRGRLPPAGSLSRRLPGDARLTAGAPCRNPRPHEQGSGAEPMGLHVSDLPAAACWRRCASGGVIPAHPLALNRAARARPGAPAGAQPLLHRCRRERASRSASTPRSSRSATPGSTSRCCELAAETAAAWADRPLADDRGPGRAHRAGAARGRGRARPRLPRRPAQPRRAARAPAEDELIEHCTRSRATHPAGRLLPPAGGRRHRAAGLRSGAASPRSTT